ncbi:MAG: racE [Gammaproteobacteria bacterium]|jgi:glutamate racemase|nr:racE [Gammaproteobacteria bacterium]
MAKHSAVQPIGIFDSGIGGLTVANALVNHLPNENIIYFGDTAHMPYGDKSASAVQAYSIKIAHMLLQQHCKLIVIACYSATSVAYELVKEYVASKAIVMNVIDPMVHYIHAHHAHQRIGLIGTRQTINSNVYKKKIDKLNSNIELTSLATNLLASAIEEFGNSKVIDSLLDQYLSHPMLKNLDALILGCTHYPVVKENISRYFKNKIQVIDPSDIVAKAVKQRLEENQLLNIDNGGQQHFYVSDYTESFSAGTKMFFNGEIHLKHYPLWN